MSDSSEEDEDLPFVDVTKKSIERWASLQSKRQSSSSCVEAIVVEDSPPKKKRCVSPVSLAKKDRDRSPVLVCEEAEERTRRKRELALVRNAGS